MFINRFHSLKPIFTALIFSLGIFCFAISGKADQWGDWTYYAAGDYAMITGYTGTNFDIMIPDVISNAVVFKIGNYAFANRTNLTSVTLPNGITDIGNYAFSNCYSLTTVSISTNVTSIGRGTFMLCSNLTSENPGTGFMVSRPLC